MNADLAASYRFCEQVSRREARNFYPSFLLLPTDRRRSMCALYAFLRRSDDIADDPGEPAAKLATLGTWRKALDSAVDGVFGGDWPGWLALGDTVRSRGIPPRYLHEVLDGVASDVEPRPFAVFDDLYAYCYRVASAVGLCCLHVWGFRSDGGRAEALAESTGVALQLTNILRDVAEDARNGRIYLPRAELEQFGVDPDDLAKSATPEPLRQLLEFEARRAYDYYERAAPLASLVSPEGRPVLLTIVGVYRALLDEIVRRRFDVMSARVSIPSWRKAAIATRSLASRFVWSDPRGLEAPPVR